MHRSRPRASVSPGLARFFGALVVIAAGAPASQVQSPQQPPSNLQGPAHYVTFHRSADHLVSGAKWEMTEKLVTIRTTWLRPGADAKVFDKQPVRYWPTCVSKIGDREICVAGKSPRSGNTIVELWTLKLPSIGSGGTLAGSTLESVVEIYDAKVTGREDVRAILPLWGATAKPESVLLWFEQSREVWRVRIATGETVLVASPAAVGSSGTSAFHAPYLSEATRAWAGIESGGGYVYTFDRRANDVPLDVGQPSLLVLRDSARDGILDSVVLETAGTLISAGWNQSSHWTAW